MQGVNKTKCDSPIVSLFCGSLLCFQVGKGGAANRDFVDSVILEHMSNEAAAAVMPAPVPHVRVGHPCDPASSGVPAGMLLHPVIIINIADKPFFIDCEARHRFAYVKSGWLYLIRP